MLFVYTGETVLFDYEDTEAVAYIQKCRSHWIVAGTVGIAA
jgi:hypothetical protein